MKPKTIIISALVLIVIGYLLALSYKKSASSTASIQGADASSMKSMLTSPETVYDFGTISMKNNEVTREFTVTNPTDKNIKLTSLATSCMCTNAFLVETDGTTKGPFGMAGMGGMTSINETIKPGESRIVRAVYDPNAHGPAGVGGIDRFIMLTEESGAMMRFEIKANVTP